MNLFAIAFFTFSTFLFIVAVYAYKYCERKEKERLQKQSKDLESSLATFSSQSYATGLTHHEDNSKENS